MDDMTKAAKHGMQNQNKKPRARYLSTYRIKTSSTDQIPINAERKRGSLQNTKTKIKKAGTCTQKRPMGIQDSTASLTY
jgi:hypothetical protein